MFHPRVVAKIAREHQETFRALIRIEEMLNLRFTQMETAIRALILGVAGGEPLLLIGSPGTGKSRLIRSFCGLTGLLDEENPERDHDHYFEYLLTPFTEPSELFGYYNISKAMQDGEMVRIEKGMMQNARVVYLDEIFNGSSAILNSILAFLNERVFHDRGLRRPVAMQCLFAASNHIPEATELRAVFDRFVLRCRVENVSVEPSSIGSLLQKGWLETYGSREAYDQFPDLLLRLSEFQASVRDYTRIGQLIPETGHPFYKRLAQQVHHARQYGLSQMSNRRLIKMTYLMLIHRILEAVAEDDLQDELILGDEQLRLLPAYFLDQDDEEIVGKMMLAEGR